MRLVRKIGLSENTRPRILLDHNYTTRPKAKFRATGHHTIKIAELRGLYLTYEPISVPECLNVNACTAQCDPIGQSLRLNHAKSR